MVVGASLAGVRAAETMRREGFDGVITILGAERHFPPFDRPPLSKQVLAGSWDVERARLRVVDALDAEVRLGVRASALDLSTRDVVLTGGERVGFDGLVIATGAIPRTIPGTEHIEGVHVLRSLEDCLELRGAIESASRVAVIGAGFIGSEVASTARALGRDVSLVEALPLPLVRIVGEEIGQFFADLHRDNGVQVHLGGGVAGIEGDSRVERVRLADGTAIDADIVVVGIGVRPATDWLVDSGLHVNDGVVCDETLAAKGAAGVVAAGDIARWPHRLFDNALMRIEHWTNAAEQGEHAATTLVRGPARAAPFETVPYFWSDQHGVKIQFVGVGSPDDEIAVSEGSIAERKFVASFRRRGRVVGALCVNAANRTIAWREAVLSGIAPAPA